MLKKAVIAAAAVTMLHTHAVHAQTFPAKQIRVVVPLAAGGNLDLVARAVAQQMGEAMDQRLLVEYRPGSSSLDVPYKGNSQAIIDVIGGQVAMMFDQVSTSAPHIKAGKLRALGVSSRTRSPLLPQVPTVDEAGVRAYDKGRAHRRAAAALRERGVELTSSATPEAFTSRVSAEVEKMRKLASVAGLKPE
jgi:tripartite-type tricarboxylate transporter receptor subunit TctC